MLALINTANAMHDRSSGALGVCPSLLTDACEERAYCSDLGLQLCILCIPCIPRSHVSAITQVSQDPHIAFELQRTKQAEVLGERSL